MSLLDSLFIVERAVPKDVLAGLATGQYSLYGGVVRDGAGQIVRHLVSTTSSSGLNPFGLLTAVPSLVNVYQLHQLKDMTMALMQISQTTMLLSGLNLAVGVAGFAALKMGLSRVEDRIKQLDQKLDWIKTFLATERRGKLLSAINALSNQPSDARNAFQILHTARATLDEARMCYLEHWDQSRCLDESMCYQHYYCTAFLAQVRCSAELGEHDMALGELRDGVQSWRERARSTANERLLSEDRARYLDAKYVQQVPAAKLAGWMDFASGAVRGYQWIDDLRQEHRPSLVDTIRSSKHRPSFIDTIWSSKLSEEEGRGIEYLDNLTSRDSVLRGYEAQLEFMAEHKIKPSAFAEEVGRLRQEVGEDVVLVLKSRDEATVREEGYFPAASEDSSTEDRLADINKEELLNQLATVEEDAARSRRRFVGLAWFVKTHLGDQGYAIGPSYGLINSLEKEGVVEIYVVQNLKGGHPVTAVRSIHFE
jgi:hypothetical protein